MTRPTTTRDLAQHIVATLQERGHTAYFAGGCVRDQLLHRTPKDYDVATSARPDDVLALFPRSEKVGVSFGVVLVRMAKLQAEVATFRTDGNYDDGRHPTSVTFATPQEDANRRDFTCNGLFYDPIANTIHDYVDGQSDIQQKILRAIGDPEQRFAEDHLRMLRAVRLSTRLDFTIDPATAAAITRQAAKIKTISKERIGEEFRLMLESPSRAAALAQLHALGLLQQTWPHELLPLRAPTHWPRLTRLSTQSSVLSPQSSPPLRHTALLAVQLDLDASADASGPDYWTLVITKLRQAFMLSNQESDDMLWLATRFLTLRTWTTLTNAAFKRILADPRWPQLALLLHAEPALQPELPALDTRIAALTAEGVAPTPFITGTDLIALGAAPGKRFKAWLDQLYDRQLELQLKDRADALAAARSLVQSNHPS